MNIYLLIASVFVFLLAFIHSLLGELKLFRHMKNSDDLPALNGFPLLKNNPDSARLTLRMVWHMATALGLGIAGVLIYLSGHVELDEGEVTIVKIISVSMFLSFLIALIVSKGNHMAWIVFLLIGVFCILGIS